MTNEVLRRRINRQEVMNNRIVRFGNIVEQRTVAE